MTRTTSTTSEDDMARQKAPKQHEDLNLERTRASSVWVAIAVGVVLLILLIDFIAQNNRRVPIHFFTLNGRVSEALALLVAAVGGAVVVLMAGAARIIQLRVSTRRHNRRVRKAADAETDPAPSAEPATTTEPSGSAAPAAEGEAQPVETQPNT
jgi:uncharacterized integral membrane protein